MKIYYVSKTFVCVRICTTFDRLYMYKSRTAPNTNKLMDGVRMKVIKKRDVQTAGNKFMGLQINLINILGYKRIKSYYVNVCLAFLFCLRISSSSSSFSFKTYYMKCITFFSDTRATPSPYSLLRTHPYIHTHTDHIQHLHIFLFENKNSNPPLLLYNNVHRIYTAIFVFRICITKDTQSTYRLLPSTQTF